MPQGFLECVRKNGRVRSKRINKSQYIKLCFIGGKSYKGEVHNYKKITKQKNA